MFRYLIIILFVTLFFIASLPLLLYILRKAKKDPEGASLFTQHVLCRIADAIVWLSGAEVQYEGLEHIKKDGPALYVGNHRSLFDPLILYSLVCGGSSRVGFIAKKEWQDLPVVNRWLGLANVLYLDRKNLKEGLKTILEAISLVKGGCSMIIYPEGTRGKSADEKELLPFHDGSFKIAKKAGCPVIPVVVSNTSSIFEDHKPFVKKSRVKIRICPSVSLDELSEEAQKHPGAYFMDYFRTQLSGMEQNSCQEP